jgi:putative transposase
MNQDCIAEACKEVHRAFERWLYGDSNGKKAGKPQLKSERNKVGSVTFGQASRLLAPKSRRIHVPGIGKIRCSAEELLPGKIKGGRLVKRASGYYFQYVVDAEHVQELQQTDRCAGADSGFAPLLMLSYGTPRTQGESEGVILGREEIENPREFRKGEKRLAQAQRGNNKHLTARLHEHQKNRRKDRNHKLSHRLVKENAEIYFTGDDLDGQKTLFGKSVTEAGIGQLRNFTYYKSQSCGRKCDPKVNNRNSTRECHCCGNLTGPSGIHDLGVRVWECSICGTVHDRNENSAIVTLKRGLGYSLRLRENRSQYRV